MSDELHPDSVRLASRIAHDYFAQGMDYYDWRQEALVAAWEAEQIYDGTITLQRWVAFVIRRRLQDVLTKTRALKRPRFAELLPEIVPAAADHSADDVVAAILEELSPQNARLVVGLAGGLTYEELMEQEGLSYKGIDNRLYKARKKLRDRLAA